MALVDVPYNVVDQGDASLTSPESATFGATEAGSLPAPTVQWNAAAPVATKAAGPPPGSWYNAPAQAQPMPMQAGQPYVPRRFPGHFMPHRLCNHFTMHSWCRRADACTFAHGLQELHPDSQAQMAASQMVVQPQTVVVKGKGKGFGKTTGKYYTVAEAPVPLEAGGAEGEADPSFQFNASAQPFVLNASAQPFVPSPVKDAEEEETSPSAALAEPASEDKEEEEEISPGRRKPAPLDSLDESPNIPSLKAMAMPALMVSPTSSVLKGVTVIRQHPMASPASVVTSRIGPVVGQPLSSPKTIMISPTKYLGASFANFSSFSAVPASPTAVGSSAAAPVAVPASPVSAAVAVAASPAPAVQTRPASVRGGAPAHFVLMSPSGAAWSGSPSLPPAAVPAAPQSPLAQPASPVPISKGQLLQARQVVQRLQEGPPGLASCGPTPTTKAAKTGFQFPQPGWIRTIPAAVPKAVKVSPKK